MATLVLAGLGKALGAGFGGAVFGLSGAVIGGAIGTALGSVVDGWLIGRLTPQQRIQGARLDVLQITSATEGQVVPRLHGRMRLGGNIIWATDFREKRSRKRKRVSKYQKVTITEFEYFASFAVALCEGPIAGIGRVWANGEPMDLDDVDWRWYPGDETQEPDPAIIAAMGPDAAPAYRGTAYVVFDDLPLDAFGNRIPQLSFEVLRPLADPDTAEGALRAITLIPSAGEIVYAAQTVRGQATGGIVDIRDLLTGGPGAGPPLNETARAGVPDLVVSLDQLQAAAPNLESVSLVVSWFGDDLRAGSCEVRPRVESPDKVTAPAWRVNGLDRAAATPVSETGGVPSYGGTPADFTVVQAIQELKARGLRVTFYPFIMMDVPPGNTLPDPYSDNAAAVGQPVFPWRGRITCSPAAGFAGTVDKTATAAAQVAAFFGAAQPSDFNASGTTVDWVGPAGDWGLRRMILHYAHLCAAAGGVDAFLIGTEMRGLTTIRSGAGTYPSVQAFRDLAADVRAVLGAGTKISYAADWSEYFGHHPGDGSGDVFFHLDPLWADPDIDFIGIDNYMPLSDWRDGFDHADAQAGWPAIHDRAYLQANIAGGEGFDWFYASAADRAAQLRTPITDGAAGKPWVFRYKDLRAWWSNAHFDRPGGVESAAPTAWVPESKPIWFTEFGCPAVDRGTNQPNVFFDPKSSESFIPYFSRGWRDDAIQRAYLEATLLWWADAAHNPTSGVYGAPMVHLPECAAWTWDARPWPAFPASADLWVDGPNWQLGHWLTGRLGAAALPALVRRLCLRSGLPEDRFDVSGLWGAVEGHAVAAIESGRASIGALGRAFGFDAVESAGVIRFVMRGRAPAVRVALDGGDAAGPALPRFAPAVAGDTAAGAAELHEMTRAQESELPTSLRWTVLRSDDDRYDAAVVEAARTTAGHPRAAAESFAFALPPEEAERLCRQALAEAWTGREALALRLPPSALAVEPGDVLGIEHAGHVLQFRVASTTESTARAIEAVRQDREDRDAAPGQPRGVRLPRPPALGAAEVVLLDLPWLDDAREAHRPLLAAQAEPWPGTMATYGSADAASWELLNTFGHRAAMGRLLDALPAGRPAVWQLGDGALVEVDSGAAESAATLAVLNGANLLALESGGEWELLQFRDAALIAPRTWRLTGLLRGQRGTEWAIAAPAAAGARVVLIDPELPELPVSTAQIGLALQLRVGPASLPLTDESYVQGTVTPRAVGLVPFAPVHLRARLDGPDVRIAWTRRDRALAADNWESVEIPLSEAGEQYLVEIMDGAAVVRAITVAAPEAVYTAAQQTADWGAPLDPGDPLAIRVAQLSAVLGPGRRAAATIVLEGT